MAKLIGSYVEEKSEIVKKKKKSSMEFSPFSMGGNFSLEKEIETRKNLQSYVNVLPMRSIGFYMEDMLSIVQQIGYKDIIVFIDEADHLGKIDTFLRMLTKAREVLFFTGFTFFVAGSPEIAKHVESIGVIFDKTLFLEPAKYAEFEDVLNRRIVAYNSKTSIHHVFQKDALQTIYKVTKGVRKQFIRLAENALDVAANYQVSQIRVSDVMEAIEMGQDQIQISLSTSQIDILKKLAKIGHSSPSDKKIQDAVNLKRESLRMALEELETMGYVKKEKKGRKSIFHISSTYKPYFDSLE
jgi:hypothetical protein